MTATCQPVPRATRRRALKVISAPAPLLVRPWADRHEDEPRDEEDAAGGQHDQGHDIGTFELDRPDANDEQEERQPDGDDAALLPAPRGRRRTLGGLQRDLLRPLTEVHAKAQSESGRATIQSKRDRDARMKREGFV